jgi:hypothetical protein
MQFIINNLITVENKLRMIQMKGAAHILGAAREREWNGGHCQSKSVQCADERDKTDIASNPEKRPQSPFLNLQNSDQCTFFPLLIYLVNMFHLKYSQYIQCYLNMHFR